MPYTHFPNGLTTRTASAANTAGGDNDLNCLDLFVDGTATITGGQTFSSTITVGSGTQIIGLYDFYPVYFGTSSALQQIAVAPGHANCSLDAVYVTFSTVSALVASYTIQVGSAGAVAVAGQVPARGY